MIVEEEVLRLLERGETSGNFYRLPSGQLERKLYERVNKVLEAAGGKWNRRAQKHEFEGIAAADALEPVFLTGQIVSAKSEFGFFETPPAIADRVVALARIDVLHEVLEPSAGRGALARRALAITPNVDAIELLGANFQVLLALEPRLRVAQTGDFLQIAPRPMYDRVIMNPPFAKRADVKHIFRAAQWLRPGGRLVAIASAAVTFRDDSLGRDFRAMVEGHGGEIEKLPAGSFKESGTDVNPVLISFDV
jgi:predicted RNA methylase